MKVSFWNLLNEINKTAEKLCFSAVFFYPPKCYIISMLEIKDIEKLSKLARIKLEQAEMEKLLKEVDPILGYVAQLKEVVSTVSESKKAGELRNVMREDSDPTITGTNTKDIVDNMPDSQDDYLKVEKIL